MLRRIGLSPCRAFASASGPQGYQSTGLWACGRREGLVPWTSRVVGAGTPRCFSCAPPRLSPCPALVGLQLALTRCRSIHGWMVQSALATKLVQVGDCYLITIRIHDPFPHPSKAATR